MILSCPSCDMSYFADEDTIGRDGRQITCQACGHIWHEQQEGIPATDETLTRGAHERYLEAVRLRHKARARTTAIAVWGFMIALVAGVLITATLMRNDVARAWPQSAVIFTAVGLDVNRFGVDFENIARSRELRGTMPVLTVTADVRNVTSKDQPAPRVRVGLLDDFDREIAHIFADVEPTIIRAGEAGRFIAVLENPPAEAYRMDLRFVDRSDMTQAGSAIAAGPPAP